MQDFSTLSRKLREAILTDALADDDAFNEMALEIFELQIAENVFYRNWCPTLSVASWKDVPAIPTSAFKRAEIRSFPPEQTIGYFQTSGTTEGESGRHFFSTLENYEAAIAPPFRKYLLPDIDRMKMLILTDPVEMAPHSSLVHMMETVKRDLGLPGSDYFIRSGTLEVTRLISVLRGMADLSQDDSGGSGSNPEPVFILGTAFAFVLLLDELKRQGETFSLPAGSRIMETGGFKGRTREIGRAEFYDKLSAAFGVPQQMIVNEYGMTELFSQFYDVSIAEGRATSRKRGPSWTRVLMIDPETNSPVPHGEPGLIRIHDLANIGTVAAIQTEDVGIQYEDGFEVLGRVARAQMRGCSMAVEGRQVT